MNEIINWLALNNTLMIRIGFSAVILLMLVYVFRFFFMPSVKQISDSSDSSDAVVTASESVKPESKAGETTLNSEELTKLQAEISTLKYKLKEVEAEKNTLATQASVSPAASSAGVEMVPPSQPVKENISSTDAAAQAELEEKVKILEARLQEYEIIAEDIAEVSRLRQENETLKAKVTEAMSATANASAVKSETEDFDVDLNSQSMDTAEEPLVADEPQAESDLSTESQLLDDYISAKSTPVEVNDMSRIVITSDVEVTPEEKNALNDFENFQMRKKG